MTVFLSKKFLTLQYVITLGITAAFALLITAPFSPAYADGTFLLQLGSFDNESEANQKWIELKTKNADVLDKMTLHVAEVSMPPDNKVSYRTQAGPVATREQASSICNTLENRGVDCYVVETALFTGESMPDQAAAATATNTPVTVSEAPAAQAAGVAQAPAPVAAVPSAPAPAESAAAPLTPATSSTLDPATSAAVPAPVLTSTVVPLSGQEPSNAPPVSAPESIQASAQSPVAAVDMPAQPVLPPTDHMVPGREPKFLTLPASMGGAAPQPAPTQIAAATPQAPPAPQHAPAPAPAPEKRGFFSRLFGGSSEPAAAGSSVGNVNVAEAIRVPLSDDKSQAPATATPPAPAIVATAPAVQGLGGTPDSDSARTYWAQLSYFRDEYQARSFYQDFHAAYPQFSNGVRVRITRPYSYATTPGHVSLRVGPFASATEIQAICSSAVHYHLRCTVVRDLGSSIASGFAGSYMANKPLPSAAPNNQPTEYWVQLGTFHSNYEALQQWKTLRESHKRALRRVRFSVSSPTQSSAQLSLYRLRAGPFKNEASADRLCNSIRNIAPGCVVLSDH